MFSKARTYRFRDSENECLKKLVNAVGCEKSKRFQIISINTFIYSLFFTIVDYRLDSDIKTGCFYSILLFKRLLNEKLVYGFHSFDNQMQEDAEEQLLQCIFDSTDYTVHALQIANTRMLYRKLNFENHRQCFASISKHADEVVILMRGILDR